MTELTKDQVNEYLNTDFARRVSGFENYIITCTGNLYKLSDIKYKKITATKKNTGYLESRISFENKTKYALIHRLVAQAFIPNLDDLPQVNHKNEIKTDNRVDNLEWCTAKYNMNYGTARERSTAKQSKAIIQIDIRGNIIKYWDSIQEAGRNGFDASNICACLKGRLNRHRGFKWRYA